MGIMSGYQNACVVTWIKLQVRTDSEQLLHQLNVFLVSWRLIRGEAAVMWYERTPRRLVTEARASRSPRNVLLAFGSSGFKFGFKFGFEFTKVPKLCTKVPKLCTKVPKLCAKVPKLSTIFFTKVMYKSPKFDFFLGISTQKLYQSTKTMYQSTKIKYQFFLRKLCTKVPNLFFLGNKLHIV